MLLRKWLRRFGIEQESFWRKVIVEKYEEMEEGKVLS